MGAKKTQPNIPDTEDVLPAFEVQTPILHDGQRFDVGQTIHLDDTTAQALGAAVRPQPPATQPKE